MPRRLFLCWTWTCAWSTFNESMKRAVWLRRKLHLMCYFWAWACLLDWRAFGRARFYPTRKGAHSSTHSESRLWPFEDWGEIEESCLRAIHITLTLKNTTNSPKINKPLSKWFVETCRFQRDSSSNLKRSATLNAEIASHKHAKLLLISTDWDSNHQYQIPFFSMR